MQAGGGEAGRHVCGNVLNGADVLLVRRELAVARHPDEVSVLMRRPLVLHQKMAIVSKKNVRISSNNKVSQIFTIICFKFSGISMGIGSATDTLYGSGTQ